MCQEAISKHARHISDGRRPLHTRIISPLEGDVSSMYRYSPLANQHIRVAELHPGHFDDNIVVTLRSVQFDLERPPQYETLSYAWGSDVSPSPLYVSGVPNEEIQVKHNLDIALRYLRYADKSRHLWIDAICINQDDSREKGAQVAMMGEIYSLAERVMVWLGPEENQSDRAMRVLEDMGSQIDFDQDTFSLRPSKNVHDQAIGDITVDLPYEENDLTNIYHLLCRSWFERLWVRQEIFLANDAAMAVCGHYVMLWQTFQCGLACIYLKGRKNFQFQNELTDRLDVLRGLLFGQRKVALSTLRRDFGMLHCADPRDRVYALLGILHRGYKNLNIQPDYSKPAAQVYEDFVARYISCTGDISILTACHLSESWSAPSWVPDWSRRVATRVETRIWSARVMFASSHFAHPLSAPVNGKLEVAGVLIGTIQKLRQVPLGRLTTGDMADIIRDISSDESTSHDNVAGGTLLEACVRTMCLDTFAESFWPPLEYLPKLDMSIQQMKQILQPQSDSSTPQLDNDTLSLFQSKAQITLGGRCIYKLDNGHIGLGPVQTKVGDRICIVLGSNLPMILRHVANDQYLHVGTCYTCGVGIGEALLGPLPRHIRLIQTLEEVGPDQQWRRTFVDDRTGESSLMDPRLSTWPIDHADYSAQLEKGTDNFLKVDPGVWRAKGVSIQPFALV